MVLEMGGRWLHSCCFVGYFFQDLFNMTPSNCRQAFSPSASSASKWCIHILVWIQPLLWKNCILFYQIGLTSIWLIANRELTIPLLYGQQYTYVYFKIGRFTKRFVFFELIYLFCSYMLVCFHLVAFVREHIWHKVLLMGYSMRLELTHVCSLNAFQLVMGLYSGHLLFFWECVYLSLLYIYIYIYIYRRIMIHNHTKLLWCTYI